MNAECEFLNSYKHFVILMHQTCLGFAYMEKKHPGKARASVKRDLT